MFNSYQDHTYLSMCLSKSMAFFSVKQRGELISPSEPVFQIVVRCEKLLGIYFDQSFMSKHEVHTKLLAVFNQSVCEDRPTQFFSDQCDLEEGQLDHRHQVTQHIVSKYFKLRFKYHSKL